MADVDIDLDQRRELISRLERVFDGQLDATSLRRAEYSTDASNYRVVPAAVAFPRTEDDVVAAVSVASELGVPLTMRGAGTSVAGNAVGPGLILDTSRHLTAIDIDPQARTAVTQGGVILADLQRAAAAHGLRFGPDPSTQSRCTIGGMIGNNACGPHALAYGRTADNVVDMRVVNGTGAVLTAANDLAAVPGLTELATTAMPLLRTEFGRFSRQVSGYSLEHLLPENGTHLAKALVGTEGTCALTLRATLNLVPVAPAQMLAVLAYPTMADAADAVPALSCFGALAIEGLDARLVEVVRRHRGPAAVPDLPDGGGWLLVLVGADHDADASAQAAGLVAASGAIAHRLIPAGPEASAVWRIRADGAGLAGRTPAGTQAWPGWEDAAVPPQNLGRYLRRFDQLLQSYGLDGLPYGHFGDGCVHVRIDFPLQRDPGMVRSFMTEAAHLVAEFGGSFSGEHGDGRARSELLPIMYSQPAIDTMAAFKQLFDPGNVLNPGVVIDPRPLDADLRRPAARRLPATTGYPFAGDDGDFTTAVHRCVGVGKCRADNSGAGDFMCPSYQATKDEKDSTRGRARVLQEMANGTLVSAGWRSREVHEVLDLCLSCRACSSDCPAAVDMAQYKSEVLHRAYSGRLRPMNHYALGWLPRWGRLISLAPRLVNALLGVRPIAKLVLAAGGMDTRRTMPRFAERSFGSWWNRRADRAAAGAGAGATGLDSAVEEAAAPSSVERAVTSSPRASSARPRVLLWADSFSEYLDTRAAQAMVSVLENAGYQVLVPDDPACCGLTWISTGQLTGARRRMRDLCAVLGPFAVNGIPIVGVEPSCTAVLRSDLVELCPDDRRAQAIAQNTYTLAELLTAPAPVGPAHLDLPDMTGLQITAQPHCHQHAVMGYRADVELLRQAGAEVTVLAGCCGLAGNFGMERGHYDVSVAVAENSLLPALRELGSEGLLLADGYSCRTQAEQLAGTRGRHLAEILHDAGGQRTTARRPGRTAD